MDCKGFIREPTEAVVSVGVSSGLALIPRSITAAPPAITGGRARQYDSSSFNSRSTIGNVACKVGGTTRSGRKYYVIYTTTAINAKIVHYCQVAVHFIADFVIARVEII